MQLLLKMWKCLLTARRDWLRSENAYLLRMPQERDPGVKQTTLDTGPPTGGVYICLTVKNPVKPAESERKRYFPARSLFTGG